MNDCVTSKEEILVALIEQQQRIRLLFTTADYYMDQGKLDQALVTFEQLIDLLRNVLQLEERHNQYYPDSPFEIPPTVHQLLNAMNMEADVLEALGYPERSEETREEAEQLTEAYLVEAEHRGERSAARRILHRPGPV